MTGHQLRAARRRLGWSAARLALESHTAEFVITKFEESGRLPLGYPLGSSIDPMAGIRNALATAGIAISEIE